MRSRDQIGDAPVAARRDFGHRGVTVQAEEGHGRGQYARALVVALVEHFARGRCDDGMRGFAKMPRRHHPMQRQLEWTGRIAEEIGDAAQRLVLACIEHMQDCTDQQRVRRFLPVVAALKCAFRVHQDVGDVLHVAHLMRAAPYLQQGVVGRRLLVGGVEQQAVREP